MEGKLRILLTIGVIFAFLSGNAFAGNDCTFTPNPSGWQFPYDNVAYRLQAERTWINIPIAHVQVQPTSSSWEHQGSLKVFVNGNAVTLYGDYDLQNSIGTSFDYLAGSGNIDFWFYTGYDTDTQIELKHWEQNVGSWYVDWTMQVSCPETITTPGTPTGETNPIPGTQYQYNTTGAASSLGHNIEYRFNWDDGTYSSWSTNKYAYKTWNDTATRYVKVEARCQAHTTISKTSGNLTVTPQDQQTETITTPGTPTGETNPIPGTQYQYNTTGAASSLGHNIEYRFNWDDGTYSSWSTNKYAYKTWNDTATRYVKVEARCQAHTTISKTSGNLTVTPQDQQTEIITKPGTPTGETNPMPGTQYQYNTTGAANSLGHTLEYRFNWGDGTYSSWSTNKYAYKTWNDTATRYISVKARCKEHTNITNTSDSLIVIPKTEQQNTLTLMSPNSGTFKRGDNVTITWYSTGYENEPITVSMKRDSASSTDEPDDVNWYRFTTTAPNNGTFTDQIPFSVAKSNDWRFYVGYTNIDVHDRSDFISIEGTLTLTSPNSGTFKRGDNVTITWYSTGYENEPITVSMKRDSASSTDEPDDVNWYRFTTTAPNNGTFTDQIPFSVAEANDWRFYVGYVNIPEYDNSDVISISDDADGITRSADPCNKWEDWQEGDGQVNIPELKDGNASHNLSPAEIIYYSSKENDINPVFTIAKIQDESGLINPKNDEVYSNFEERLLEATGYDICYTCAGKFNGFYPQIVSMTWQFKKWYDEGKTFQNAFESYKEDMNYDIFVNGTYPIYAEYMESLVGGGYSAYPSSKGYYHDFSNEVTIDDIQQLLEYFNSPLNPLDLFRQPPWDDDLVDYSDTSNICNSDSGNDDYEVEEAVSGFQFPLSKYDYSSTLKFTTTACGYKCGCVKHPGIDWNVTGDPGGDCDKDKGLDVLAVANGTVVYRDSSSWGGLIIKHLYKDETWYSQYGHVQSIQVIKGEKVTKGQKVAEIGDEGTECAHLHFEIREADHTDAENGSYWSCDDQTGLNNIENVNNWYEDPDTFIPEHPSYFKGTTGTLLTITYDGSKDTKNNKVFINGFGATKGKVFIGNKKCKIKQWSDTKIIALLKKKLVSGEYPVIVKRTDGDTYTISTYASKRPEIKSIEVVDGNNGNTLIITGMYFGIKKGKVFLEMGDKTKKCKLKKKNWTMDASTGNSTVICKVPKKLSFNDIQSVQIKNKVGISESFSLSQ